MNSYKLPDGLIVDRVGNHFEAVSVDLAVRPSMVSVVGDARAMDDSPVVVAVVEHTNDEYWFFEVSDPFATGDVFDNAVSLLLSLAYLAEHEPASVKNAQSNERPTAIVLQSSSANLYLITQDFLSASSFENPLWTSRTIPLDDSMPWRVAREPKLVDGILRFPTKPESDRLASNAGIQETLHNLVSIRIRGGQRSAAEMVLLRQLSVVRLGSEDGDTETENAPGSVQLEELVAELNLVGGSEDSDS